MGMSGHEAECGSRTTECHVCGKNVRLRDMEMHMGWHDHTRRQGTPPIICNNINCGRILDSDNALGVCSICFGPLYNTVLDTDGVKLRRRLERRYFIQLTRGCGKEWCRNNECMTGAGHKLAIKEATSRVKELMNEGNKGVFYFCVDETCTRNMVIVNWLAEEHEYDRSWCCAAVQAAQGREDLARQWLANNAVKLTEKAEVLRGSNVVEQSA
ncbi:hypothetical protein CANCADRAFT_57915 [Tortispora caseinolytica NRRL Y-17796]|uniref:Uncharacterized protein n=1 Tax=Tortispora caseinolytica NRRL Y-17796 TaxID=767744 RepID=A0A1E4TAP1_9ASCO|nr:hypothetical protein CANCADRAFT_57915 [Tortispora caseinolytica NRRL Y-17796]